MLLRTLKKILIPLSLSVGVPGRHSSFHGPLPTSTTIHPCYPAVLLLALSLQLPRTCSLCQTRRLSVCLHPILGYDIHFNVQMFHITVLWTVTRLTFLYIHITSTFFFFFFFFYDFSVIFLVFWQYRFRYSHRFLHRLGFPCSFSCPCLLSSPEFPS